MSAVRKQENAKRTAHKSTRKRKIPNEIPELSDFQPESSRFRLRTRRRTRVCLPVANTLRYDAPDEMTRPTSLLSLAFPLATALLALLAACGGGDDEGEAPVGRLTDPRDVPTSPAWEQPPDVTILDPNALTPVPGGPSPTPEGGETGVCGPKYVIQSGDTFSSIAERCGTTTQAMREANPGVDPLTLRAGQEVNIPAPEPEASP